MRFFMGMLDIAGVNSTILFNFIPGNAAKDQCEFLKEFSFALIVPFFRKESENYCYYKNTKLIISQIIKEIKEKTLEIDEHKQCDICPIKVKRKVAWRCYNCGKAIFVKSIDV